MVDHQFLDPIGTCHACGATPQHVQTFGGFLLCAECFEYAQAESCDDVCEPEERE